MAIKSKGRICLECGQVKGEECPLLKHFCLEHCPSPTCYFDLTKTSRKTFFDYPEVKRFLSKYKDE